MTGPVARTRAGRLSRRPGPDFGSKGFEFSNKPINWVAMSKLVQYGDGAQVACDWLRARILEGDLPVGTELRIQRLARQIDISIVPVREAIRTLAAEGLVEIRPRRSPIVARPDFTMVLEISEIRRALEPPALAAAVAAHTSTTLARCRDVIMETEHCEHAWQRIVLNRDFHCELLAPSGKTRLLRIVRSLYESMSLLTHAIVNTSLFRTGESQIEHLSILDAVERRDSARAVRRLKDHLEKSMVRFELHVARTGKLDADIRNGTEADPFPDRQPLTFFESRIDSVTAA